VSNLPILLLLAAQGFSQPSTHLYTKLQISEFTVLVSPAAEANPKLLKPTLDLLAFRLRQVKQEVPAKAFKRLKEVSFWIEVNDPKNAAAAYHPDAGWLKENGYNTDMAHCVEIGNMANFLKWQHIQPSMVLHELAHSYHFRVVGEDPAIIAAYNHAVKSHIYENVPFVTGGLRKAYALTNEYEYFAECSEAYFGRNDFYPFIRSEFKTFDPQGYEAIERAWQTTEGGK
jgi:hypothetical protein